MDIFDRILLSDEAHFKLRDFVNRPSHRVTVWCALQSGGIICLFEIWAASTFTPNGKRYRNIILSSWYLNRKVFLLKQDGATYHTASQSLTILNESIPLAPLLSELAAQILRFNAYEPFFVGFSEDSDLRQQAQVYPIIGIRNETLYQRNTVKLFKTGFQGFHQKRSCMPPKSWLPFTGCVDPYMILESQYYEYKSISILTIVSW